MKLEDAQKLTLQVLKQVMEDKVDHHNVQLAQVSVFLCPGVRIEQLPSQVTPEKGFEILDEARLKEIIEAM